MCFPSRRPPLSFWFDVPARRPPAHPANVFFVFLPGGISKEYRHIVSANWDFEENYLADIVKCLRAYRGTPGEIQK